MDVAALVRAAGTGDEDAWNALVERFGGLVWATIRAHRLSGADADDVFQTAWLRLAEHLGRIREPAALGGWLAQTARHECLRLLRLRGRELPSDDDAAFERAALDTAPEAGLVTAERESAVWRAFERLSDRCQALLRVLIAEPPPSYEEVSEALSMPIGSIGPTRQRCLDNLRRIIGEGAAEGLLNGT